MNPPNKFTEVVLLHVFALGCTRKFLYTCWHLGDVAQAEHGWHLDSGCIPLLQ